MRSIPLALIEVPKNRQRTTIDEPRIRELAASMSSIGQITPICVRSLTNGRFELIAGERRLKAKSLITAATIRCGQITVPPGEIGALLWDELDPLQQYEMELEENIRRVDLSWQDQTRAVARLGELRKQQAHKNGEVFSVATLAAEAGIAGGPSDAPAAANVMMAVAKHMDDPNVASAKSLKEAQKVVEKKLRDEQLGQLASVFEQRAAKECPHRLLRGDAFNLLASMPPGIFHACVTDPPYGIGADEFGDQAGEGHSYADDDETFQRIASELPKHLFRILREQAHLYLFCAFEKFDELAFSFGLEGFDVWPRPLIWAKGNGMLPKPQHGPRYTYECILFANKGGRNVEYVASDVLTVSKVQAPRHGAEKPVALIRDLLGRSMRPGETVLDPFAGSGTIFPAASLAKVAATGIERDERYANLAASRLMEETAGSALDLLA